jgi:alcohol dehydrogenase (cytochrome c)
MRSSTRLLTLSLAACAAIIVLLVCASLASPAVAWRVKLLSAKLTGKIPEIPLPQLLRWMRPASPVNLYQLAQLPSVDASVTNTFNDSFSAVAGVLVFGRTCAPCHGDDARGQTGPNLLAAVERLSDWQFFATVKWGRTGTIMRPQPLSDLEIWQVGAFLRQSALDALVGKNFAGGPKPFRAISAEMLRDAGGSGDWLTYAGNYAGYRHGVQDQITAANVGRLRLAWAAQLPTDGTVEQSSPIVANGLMFVTEPPEGVTALDAETGAVLWQFHRSVPRDIPACCGYPNRGVAVLGNYIYVETSDSHLLALDAATGRLIWDATVADWHAAYTMSAAPLAFDDRVIVGVGGGDFGIRGFLAAYSAANGAQLWKLYTVPGPGEPGHESWGSDDSWRHGGAATWVTGAYDPALGLIYWGTGNPGPVFDAKRRPGANLYSESVIAVDARTGKLRWYYQFTPGDVHGWDSTEQPVLADISWQGEVVPALLMANRNAFLYALDRRTGRFLFAAPFARQTWAKGFSADGKPALMPATDPTRSGDDVSPPLWGATSWWPPSFDPVRHLLFVPSVDSADTFFDIESDSYREGQPFLAGAVVRARDKPTTLALRALDVSSGHMRWDRTLERGGGEVPGEMGGVLSTAGGLIFAGHGSEFDAYDADDGTPLWGTSLGGKVAAAPISYTLDGREYVGVIASRTLFSFALPTAEIAAAARSTPVRGSTSGHIARAARALRRAAP